jgi:hypothetical protein
MVEMRKRNLLIILAILAIGLIGTSLSSLCENQNEMIEVRPFAPNHWVSFGFPISWYGYREQTYPELGFRFYWFSLVSFLVNTVFWTAISTLGYFVITILIDVLHKVRASKNLSVINI